MTYRFKCPESSDVLMLKADGDEMLRLIGRDPAAKGIIETAALPAAIDAIERAIGELHRPHALAADANDSDSAPAEPGGGVALHQRSWPLLQMLRSAQAAAVDVTWGF